MKTARIFRDLHSNPGKPLILPNVWDAGGARLVESVGAKAVATTSAGVAWSKGYPDGNKIQPRLLAHLAGEIVKTVKVPVSIDFEAGYSDKPVVVVEYLKPIVAAGISGINIEDGIDEPALLAKKIEAIKKMLSSEGVDVFVNARTDVYLQDLVADEQPMAQAILFEAHARDQADRVKMLLDIIQPLAEGVAILHHHTDGPEDLAAAMAARQAHAEVGALQLNCRMLQKVDHRSVAEARLAV